MADVINNEEEDLYLEHEFHDVYLSNCSSCYSDNKEEEKGPWTDRPEFGKDGLPSE